MYAGGRASTGTLRGRERKSCCQDTMPTQLDETEGNSQKPQIV